MNKQDLTTVFNDALDANDQLIDNVLVNNITALDHKGMVIHYMNGETLSVIRGPHTYGGKSGLFEVLPSDQKMLTTFDPDSDYNDTVEGFLSSDDVISYIGRCGQLKALSSPV